MRGALDKIAGLLAQGADAFTAPWARLRFLHTTAIRSRLAELYAPATANKMLSALRGVLGAAFDLGLIGAEEYQRAVKVKGVKGETLPAGRSVTLGELAALMATCANDQSAAGPRDAAMIALLYSCGLRRAELVGLDLTGERIGLPLVLVSPGNSCSAHRCALSIMAPVLTPVIVWGCHLL